MCVTDRKRSWGKIMFSQVSVIVFVGALVMWPLPTPKTYLPTYPPTSGHRTWIPTPYLSRREHETLVHTTPCHWHPWSSLAIGSNLITWECTQPLVLTFISGILSCSSFSYVSFTSLAGSFIFSYCDALPVRTSASICQGGLLGYNCSPKTSQRDGVVSLVCLPIGVRQGLAPLPKK